MFYLRRRVIPGKSLLYFLSSWTICSRTVVINEWETTFDVDIVLRLFLLV